MTSSMTSSSAPQHQPAQSAAIRGHVTYREGDGPELKIPEGPAELHPAPDSVTLRWKTDNGGAGQAALPRSQYDQYVRDGKIVPGGTSGASDTSGTDGIGGASGSGASGTAGAQPPR